MAEKIVSTTKSTPVAPIAESTVETPTVITLHEKQPEVETPAPAVVDQGVQVTETTTTTDTGSSAETSAVNTPVKTISAAPVVVEKQVEEQPSKFAEMLAQVKSAGTVAERSLVAALEAYIEKMRPGKPIESDAGARQQYILWRALQNIVNNAAQGEFKALWALVLAFFVEYKESAFHERYVFRFSEYWIQSSTELTAFQRLLNLIILTATPATRAQGLKQVDLNRTLAEGFNEDGRNRLTGFYKK